MEFKLILKHFTVPTKQLGAKLQEVTVEENVAYWNRSDT